MLFAKSINRSNSKILSLTLAPPTMAVSGRAGLLSTLLAFSISFCIKKPNDFSFDSKLSKKFRLTIYNGDNQALNISSVTTKGYKHEVVARFTEDAQYVLAYGNKSARTPAYDINRFTNTIPKTPKAINLGTEQTIKKSDPKTVAPLFENEYWLWAIMGVIILLLGFFTLKMIKKTT